MSVGTRHTCFDMSIGMSVPHGMRTGIMSVDVSGVHGVGTGIMSMDMSFYTSGRH